jgi:2',3'-cyclic-nucleotide 2'-phosphodiesterase (5'-nucleotidase family)
MHAPGRLRVARLSFRKLAQSALFTAFAATFGACEGCHPGASATQPTFDASGPPTFRLYMVTDLSGAMEPCGCVKDQLGGLDHFAAWVHAEQPKAPESALVLSGPVFFLDPTLKEDHRAQDITKAETIAAALKDLHAIAFAPGKNDFAAGSSELEKLASISGASIAGANLTPNGAAPNWGAPFIRNFHGINVGFIGVSALDKAEGGAPDGMVVQAPTISVREQAETLKKQGARAIIVLAAVGRGEAKRIADAVPDLTAIVVGSPGGRGEANTETPPAERVGNVLIAETGNHLTSVAALDLYVRDAGVFADGSGLDKQAKRADLQRRVDELHGKIASWETDDGGSSISKTDLDARKADLTKLEADLATLDQNPPAPSTSFFRYAVQEIRDTLGKDPGVTAQTLAYYKQVNDANQSLFAGRIPKPAPPGTASYIGVDECSVCHSDAKDVWDKTAHANAYKTIADEFKQFNLDCVSCHVTGYDAAGGSTVTHVDKLKDVQCEVCHGPGSLHAKKPKTVTMPTPKPNGDSCTTCHHPPHVHEFDPKEKLPLILGPGHGKPS